MIQEVLSNKTQNGKRGSSMCTLHRKYTELSLREQKSKYREQKKTLFRAEKWHTEATNKGCPKKCLFLQTT